MDNRTGLQAIADCMDTGTENPLGSRALVVFNLTDTPLSGTAVFHAEMSWPLGTPLPPVVITTGEGTTVASALLNIQESPDRQGRSDRRHLSFDLCFAVRDVPPNGWRTYIAAYAEAQAGTENSAFPPEMPGLIVLETLRHGGDLPATGEAG